MRRIFPAARRLFFFGWALVLALPPVAAREAAKGRARAGELIVCYRADTKTDAGTRAGAAQDGLSFRPRSALPTHGRDTALQGIEARFGLREGRPLHVPSSPNKAIRIHDVWLLRFNEGADIEELLKAYRSSPNVLYAEPNTIGSLCSVPADPLYPQSASDLGLINAEEAWDLQPGANASIVVAVIDSGVESNHPDLQTALDLADSYNFINNNTSIYDDIGHGTRVAGIIGAAANNGEGIAGIAYGCTLLSLDVVNGGGDVTVADVVSAIDWAVGKGARVINMSLRFSARSQALNDACQAAYDAGTLLVASAGNEDQGDQPVYPASFNSVIGVGAVMDDGGTRAPWSNFNGLATGLVELAAPGTTVFSTIPGAQYNGTYGSGTSFAAPMVSAVGALIAANHPEMSTPAIRNQLRRTAHSLGAWSGFGLLDAHNAVATPMAPEITIASVLIDDSPSYDPGNDGDGRLDAEETVRLTVRLRNDGGDVTSLTGAISHADSEILTPFTSATWGVLRHNGACASGVPTSDTASFSGVQYVSALPVAKSVDFTLDLSGNAGAYADSLPFSIVTENAFTPPTIIDSPTTWVASRSYLVSSNTVVMEGATLAIEPGATVRFEKNGGLEVRGGINAAGTEDREITFASADDSRYGGYSPTRLAVGSSPFWAAIGDVDNDGDNDVLALNHYKIPTIPTDVSCLLWEGGQFGSEIRLGIGNIASNDSTNLNISDVDGDGVNEIIYDGKTFVWTDSGFLQEGTISPETFRAARDIRPNRTNGRWDRGAFIDDIDGDGYNDIAAINYANHTIDVRFWNGSGYSTLSRPADPSASTLFVGDADNDGWNEVVVGNSGPNDLSLFHWNGTGFDPEIRMPVGVYPYSVVVADADNDGDNDIVVGHVLENDVFILRWNGSGFDQPMKLGAGDDFKNVSFVGVADVTHDGFPDIVAANRAPSDVSVFAWDTDRSGFAKYRGIRLRQSAQLANLAHCRFEYAPVYDDSSVSQFSDCLFSRSGEQQSLLCGPSSDSPPVIRCVAEDNDGGDGIAAEGRDLIGCMARQNLGIGLRGATLTGCRAESNGNAGMTGASAAGCVATRNGCAGILATAGGVSDSFASGNGGWGIGASGEASGTSAVLNVNGIMAASASASLASLNTGAGMQIDGSAVDCGAVSNGGLGIAANDLTRCVIARNGSGLSLGSPDTTLTQCLVAENSGDGVAGGYAVSSVVHHNSGAGITGASAVADCWVVGNAGNGVESVGSVAGSCVRDNSLTGILGVQGPPYTTISRSTITENGLSGIKDSGTVSQSNILLNGLASGYDYEESRLSMELLEVDLSDNYWGPETTSLMNAYPWGSNFNIPRIYDFYDDTNLAKAKYGANLAEDAPGALPGDEAPAFLLAVAVGSSSDSIANVGISTITLVFSKDMNTSQPFAPCVSFGLAEPYSANIVRPVADGTGWLDSRTWQGLAAIQSSTGDGTHHLCVAGATAEDGFAIPRDTAHTFLVDTSGSGPANNGLAIGHSGNSMSLSWSIDGAPAGAIGFNVRRSLSPEEPFERVNASAIAGGSCPDTGLEPNTVYFYIVDIVDSDFNSVQWTPIFFGSTLRGSASCIPRAFLY